MAWTIENLQQRAQERGKTFSPAPEIAGRLADDLAQGAEVLFIYTPLDVQTAINAGTLPKEASGDLLKLVERGGDIIVIPPESRKLEPNADVTMAMDMLLSRKSAKSRDRGSSDNKIYH